MRTAVTTALLALTVCVGACSGPKEDAFTREDTDAIRKVAADLVDGFNAKDVDKILALYADNSVFMPPNGPLLRGREPLKSFYTNQVASSTDLKMTPEDVAGSGPLGYMSGAYTLNVGERRDRGKYLFVLRKVVGRWRVEYTSWNSDLPPAS